MLGRTKELVARAHQIRALVLDVDGVLTDASLYYGAQGERLKRFCARDGFAIKVSQSESIPVAILSGRSAAALKARLADLGIPEELAIEGSRDKGEGLATLATRLHLRVDQIAYMGDDLPDLPALRTAGLAACPVDAAPEVKVRCHLVTQAAGGNGAVRELVELVLSAHGRWQDIVLAWERGEAKGELGPTSADKGGDDER